MSRVCRFASVLTFSLVSLSPAALAIESTNTWYLRGPYGGYAAQVAIDPATGNLLAGGNPGVFSYPAGASPDTWTYASSGLPPDCGVADLVTTPAPVVYLNGCVVARSTDGGTNWVTADGGLPTGQGIASITASAAAVQRVYATVNGVGVYRSDNKGDSWLPTASQPPRLDLILVRASPTNANLVFAASDVDANGVADLYRSADGGASWTAILASPGTVDEPQQIRDIAQDPGNPSRLLATSAPIQFSTADDGGGTIFVSADAGATWSALSTNGLGMTVPSTDCCGEPHALLFDRAANSVVYVGSTLGVFKSVDGGANWTFASSGMMLLGPRASGVQPADQVNQIAQRSDGILYAAGTSGGVYFSSDAAANWTSHTDGYASINFRSLAFQPAGGTGVVLAGAADPSAIGGVYSSADGGTSWIRSSAGLYPEFIRGIAFSTSSPSDVFAVGFQQSNYGGQFNKGLWKSTDSGVNWTPLISTVPGGNKRAIVVDPNDANRILVTSSTSIALSTDGGTTWAASTTGLPTTVAGNKDLLIGIVAGPGPIAGHTRFYVSIIDQSDPTTDPPPPSGAEGGVYYSDNGGANWTLSSGVPNLPDDSTNNLAISPTPGTLYVGKDPGNHRTGGIFKSTDYGNTWTNKSVGLTSLSFFGGINIAVDPSDPNVLYAVSAWQDATHPGGVFRSNNGGDSWVPYNIGIRDPDLQTIAIDPADHDHILAGGQEGIHEMHFAPDADQDGIPDSVEQAAAGGTGDGNLDGIPDYIQANVASTPLGTTVTPAAKTSITAVATVADYVVVEIANDPLLPNIGTCDRVSDLQLVPTDQIPLSNRMQQAAQTLSFQLPDCQSATVNIRYSNLTAYPIPVFGSFSPTVAGDPTTFAWGLLPSGPKVSVDGTGKWTLQLDQNAYGNVYAPNTGSILFQGAPGKDSIFANNFE